MKIAYIDSQVGNPDYIYYSSFFLSLKRLGVNISLFSDCLKNTGEFDAIILGLGFFSVESPNYYSRIDSLSKAKCKKVAILHKIKNHYNSKISFCKINGIDIILTTTPFSEKINIDSGIKCRTLPYCADESIFKNLNIEKEYDIGFSGALHAGKKNGCEGELMDIRVKIMNLLSERSDLRVFWNGTDSVSTRIKSTEEYVKKINECKAWLCVTGPSYDVNPRFHEVGLCGTVPLINSIPGKFYNNFFMDGLNCISFRNDLYDFNNKVDELLSNIELLKSNAEDFSKNNCSLESRGRQIINIIKSQ